MAHADSNTGNSRKASILRYIGTRGVYRYEPADGGALPVIPLDTVNASNQYIKKIFYYNGWYIHVIVEPNNGGYALQAISKKSHGARMSCLKRY